MSDASDQDDDLPVLTRVLRIGGARAGALSVAEPDEAPGDSAADFATNDAVESPFDEILSTEQLVIGSDSHERLDPYIPLTTVMIEPTERHDEPLAQALAASASTAHAPSTTHALMVPFIEPVDLPAPADVATHDSANEATENAQEQRNAANDAEDADAALREAATVEPAAASAQENVSIDETAPVPFDHDAFAMRVRESVLNDLSARIDTEFDARIAQTLRAEVEAALANLHANLREQLADAMRDVVRRAVEEEVARLRQAPDEMPREGPPA